jgi:hypothetical protein
MVEAGQHFAPPEIRISRKTVATVSLGLATLALLDGAIPQIEMITTGGHVPLSTAILKVALSALLVLALAWQTKSSRLSGFVCIWLVTMLYLLADTVYLSAYLHTSFSDIVIGYNSYYAYLLICPLAAYVADQLRERRVIVFLLSVYFVCFIIGTAQFLLVKPLLYTDSVDKSFSALSWYTMDGSVRAFSLFTSGLGYGSLCCLIGALSVALLMLSPFKKLSLLLFLCAGFACYSTLTRNCYAQFLFASLATFSLTSRRLKRWVKYSPMIFLFFAALLAWKGISTDASTSTDSAVTSNISVLLRAASWVYYISLYWTAPLAEKLLGLGIVQNSNATNNGVFALDNQYLAILMNIGLVGFILMFWLQWKMWLRLYSRAVTQPSILTVAIAGFWSTFLAVYYYNVSVVTFSLVFIIALLVRPGRDRDQTKRMDAGKAFQNRSLSTV